LPAGVLARAASVTLLIVSCSSVPVAAQQSREAEIAAEQAQKAQDLKPYRPSRLEHAIAEYRRQAVEAPSGVFPAFGNVHSGGGFAMGAGYRQFFGDASFWDVKGLYSIRNYKLIETATLLRGFASDRLTIGARLGWRDATQVGYYGLGMSTSRDHRANYRFKETYVEGAAYFRPRRWIVLDGRVGYEDYSLEKGQGSAPSIEIGYTPATAPGLGASPAYLHTQATAAIDWRRSPRYSRTGGFYGLTLHDYADRGETFSFGRLDADLIQHIPLLRETWVISLRGRIETTLADDDVVPYFLLPSLGSSHNLRGYSSRRFRDRHSLVTSAEFRWIPSALALDMALFYDAGKVTDERAQLDFGGLKSNWGIGMRFHAPSLTILRVELARGSEGWNLVVSSNAAF
jgi:outer membrane protein assembly factor BamA